MTPSSPFARSPEEALILLAARPGATPGELSAIAALAKGVDPEQLLAACMRTRTLPQVARNLTRALGSPLPEPFAPLAKRAGMLAHRNLARVRSLVLLTDALGAAGVPSISFKGPILAHQLYGDATLRQYGDLDILVDAAQLPEVVSELRELGYREEHPAFAFSSSQLRALPRWFRESHLTMSHPETGTRVELHWSLLPRLRFPTGRDLSEDPEEIRFGSRTVLTLRPEALFVYLCAHGSKHGWVRVAWVADVAATLRQGSATDWQGACRLAERVGLTSSVALAAVLAEGAMEAPLPPPLAAWVGPHRGRLAPLLVQAGRNMWDGDHPNDPAGVMAQAHLAHGGGPLGPLRYLASRAFPGYHLLGPRPLPAPLFPLYLLKNLRHLLFRGVEEGATRAAALASRSHPGSGPPPPP